MSYLYETHFHTAEVSNCGHVPAATGVELYKNAGYSGVVVTDHFATSYLTDSYPGENWKEKIDFFVNGYHEAKKYETEDFAVIFGMELRFESNSNDYLIFGIDEKFLYEHEWFCKMPIKEFKKLAEANGLTIVQAHPFREGMTITNPRYIDGVEVFNGNKRHDSANDIAAAWATKKILLRSSGSDFHETEDLARGGIYLEEFVKDSKEFRKAFLSGKFTLKTL